MEKEPEFNLQNEDKEQRDEDREILAKELYSSLTILLAEFPQELDRPFFSLYWDN